MDNAGRAMAARPERQAALEIAEAWFQFAIDAPIHDTGQTHLSAAHRHNIHCTARRMSERATARLFGWSLGGILFATLVLNAVLR